MSSLTAEVAAFVAGTDAEHIPAEVVRLGQKAILDVLGPALSGAQSPAVAILREVVEPVTVHGVSGATVIGSGIRLPPRFAALINGTAMHADDYDDTLQAVTGKYQGVHPTAPVLAAVLAVAEPAHRPGRDLLAAYHVGVEVACKLFDATAPRHVLDGLHATATCGMLGAAAGVARLRRLSRQDTRMALGIAASMAGGLQENFGTMTKPLHAGRSAECGVLAVDLAERGFTASPVALEAPCGFFQALGGGCEAGMIEGLLGAPWSFVDRGIWLKPWPTGSLSHPGMTLMLDLVRQHDIKPAEVVAVRVRTSENIHRTLLHHRPRTGLEAKFSLEFCLATLLLEREARLRHFTDDYVQRPEVQRTIGLVDYRTFDEAEARRLDCTLVTTFVDVELADGRVLADRIDYGKGSLANPMTESEVADKFRDCAGFCGWPADKAERIVALVGALPELPDVRELAACLSSADD